MIEHSSISKGDDVGGVSRLRADGSETLRRGKDSFSCRCLRDGGGDALASDWELSWVVSSKTTLRGSAFSNLDTHLRIS